MNEFNLDEDFPPLTGTVNSTNNITNQNKISSQKTSVASLMAAIKSLLDLTNDYLQNLDKEHTGIESEFLALLADGASHAMLGERVYMSLHYTSELNKNPPKATWILKASPPLGQSKEDRRVMIHLGSNHEVRKTGSFELRQKVQSVLLDKIFGSEEAGTDLTTLLNRTDIPYFTSGDFNLRHPSWDLKIDHPLKQLFPTHNRDGTIDLAFSSDQRARCEIRSDLHTTSDHETLVSTLSRESKIQTPGKLGNDAPEDNLFLQFLGRSPNYDSINTRFKLEEEAKDILEIIHTALSGSCTRSKASKVGTSWCNEEYKQAFKVY
ncbi:hypothetical protein EPUL_003649 [Erysiphe pulchra]|uniref:Endonuclease/exonuclease/phosphatase domain-containing protein n=1 Tax=Erysiphe pulchra TaxID=225359 RepID=A0A2S4PLG4_9PEZI|nr:hypothetical protein EPUL_003649 [Erysiphe pulchra]